MIQEAIAQSPEAGGHYPQSFNSIRIMTLWNDENVSVLSGVMRVRIGNSKVDNLSSGSFLVGIDRTGRLRNRADFTEGKSFDTHPTTGVLFSSIEIPNYVECLDLSKRIAPLIVRICRIPSWDLVIKEDGN